jgi:hypothetical protein
MVVASCSSCPKEQQLAAAWPLLQGLAAAGHLLQVQLEAAGRLNKTHSNTGSSTVTTQQGLSSRSCLGQLLISSSSSSSALVVRCF